MTPEPAELADTRRKAERDLFDAAIRRYALLGAAGGDESDEDALAALAELWMAARIFLGTYRAPVDELTAVVGSVGDLERGFGRCGCAVSPCVHSHKS